MTINIDNNHVTFDINQEQLKKQYEQEKRFANQEIKGHSQLKDIQSTLQLLKPKQLTSILINARKAINGNGVITNLTCLDMPLLIEPKSDVGNVGRNDSTHILELLFQINKLASDSSVQNQLTQLHRYNARITCAANIYSEFAIALAE